MNFAKNSLGGMLSHVATFTGEDPTKLELLKCAAKYLHGEGLDRDSRQWITYEAIYWFALDWHTGQTSNLYSVLSTSPFTPGPLDDGPQDELSQDLAEHFKGVFTDERRFTGECPKAYQR